MTTFSILDNLSIASPCNALWEQMAGDARSRHCQLCDKSVYNLSGMTRVEAEALLVQKEGRLCVRYFRRADGTVLTRDCPVGRERLARRMKIAAWSTIGAAVTALGAVFATLGVTDRPSCKPARAFQVVRDLVDRNQPAPITEVAGGVRPMMGEAPVVEMGKMAAPEQPR